MFLVLFFVERGGRRLVRKWVTCWATIWKKTEMTEAALLKTSNFKNMFFFSGHVLMFWYMFFWAEAGGGFRNQKSARSNKWKPNVLKFENVHNICYSCLRQAGLLWQWRVHIWNCPRTNAGRNSNVYEWCKISHFLRAHPKLAGEGGGNGGKTDRENLGFVCHFNLIILRMWLINFHINQEWACHLWRCFPLCDPTNLLLVAMSS